MTPSKTYFVKLSRRRRQLKLVKSRSFQKNMLLCVRYSNFGYVLNPKK